jgi:hypothetical protein
MSTDRRIDGAELLDEVEAFFARFVAFPSESARIASVLWSAHTHLMDLFDSTPRLAFLSPEPGSGKTRALEVTELLVPNPMLAVSASSAALFRAVADMAGRPTILFDEIDTVFGPKAKENEELRGLLNAGHRRSGVSYRCVGDGANQKVVAFPSYAAMAMGGLGSLPDTILTRSVIVRMRKRGPGEKVEPFRARLHEPEGHALRKRLAEWAKLIADQIAGVYPEMPEGVNDRPADVWEPLLIVADAAGGTWPERGRQSCVELLATATPDSVSLGVRLLMDIRTVLGEHDGPKIFTRDLIAALYSLPEAPWAELNKGKGLNEYSLGRFLKDYEIASKTVRIEAGKAKGYERADFTDAWSRYCPVPASGESVASVASETSQFSGLEVATLPGFATDQPVAAPTGATGRATLRSVAPLPSVAGPTCKGTDATDATDLPEGGCRVCGDVLHRLYEADGIHPWCQAPAEWPASPADTPRLTSTNSRLVTW